MKETGRDRGRHTEEEESHGSPSAYRQKRFRDEPAEE